jgi:hypothetical protein
MSFDSCELQVAVRSKTNAGGGMDLSCSALMTFRFLQDALSTNGQIGKSRLPIVTSIYSDLILARHVMDDVAIGKVL